MKKLTIYLTLFIFTFNIVNAITLSNYSYSGNSFNASTQVNSPTQIRVVDSGTRMYIGDYANDKIFQYHLTTAYNVSTAVYDNTFKAFVDPWGIYIKPDGSKIYLAVSLVITQYTMTNWNISTISADSKTFDSSGQMSLIRGMWMSDDGTKMLLMDFDADVYQYSLSTAWDISTTSYDNIMFDASTNTGDSVGIYMNKNYTEVFISDYTADQVDKYNLTTAYNVSTMVYDSTLSTSPNTAPRSVNFVEDESKYYNILAFPAIAYQFDGPAPTPTDTCSCPTSGDWNVLASDNCTISTDCDIGTNTLIIAGTGSFTFSADIICGSVSFEPGVALIPSSGGRIIVN